MEWYDNLAKPSWTPFPSTISLIWTILYPIIVISFGFVFVKAYQGKVPRIVAVPFDINLVANLLFMPIFAGLIRYDEIQRGYINHAIRFTAECTQQSYLWPARHEAGQAKPDCPPMGARFRLNASFSLPSSASPRTL